MSYLIVGASSGLGREIAYKFAEKGHNLIICSRDIKDLEAIKSDIEYKNKNKVTIEEIDISDKKNLETFLNKEELFKDLNGVLLPVGLMFDKDNVDLSFEESEKIFKSNFSCLTYIISKLRKKFKTNEESLIVGFGSVSGKIGRNFNSYYAASKRALESYFESLAFDENKTCVQIYILGYMDTNLSFGKDLKLPKGSPKKLAEIVYKNKNKKFKKIYYPVWWSFISLIFYLVPINVLIKLLKNLKS
tara:strand:- start:3883 stop:4620 length:738 start_codon:yes stop_codon:yes gene_type:complete